MHSVADIKDYTNEHINYLLNRDLIAAKSGQEIVDSIRLKRYAANILIASESTAGYTFFVSVMPDDVQIDEFLLYMILPVI